MSLKEIREKNKLKDSFIYSNSKREEVRIKLSEEDKDFYKALMKSSRKIILKHLDEVESKEI